MKKPYTWPARPEKFRQDPKMKYVRKFRIYPSFMFHRLDTWLSQKSLMGLHLVDSNLISFLFEQGPAREVVYFTYEPSGSRNGDWKYSIPFRYPRLDQTYGVKKKKSKLNRNQAKWYRTIEIDTQRIDVQNDIAYQELVLDRNKLYKKRAIRNLMIFIAFIAFFLGLFLLEKYVNI